MERTYIRQLRRACVGASIRACDHKIVHINDIHGRSTYQEESVVGFEKLAALIAQEQKAA